MSYLFPKNVQSRAKSVFGKRLGTPTQTGDQQPNHRDLDECFAGLHLALVILTQAARTGEPTKGALNHPPTRLDTEAAYASRPLYHFQVPVAFQFAPVG